MKSGNNRALARNRECLEQVRDILVFWSEVRGDEAATINDLSDEIFQQMGVAWNRRLLGSPYTAKPAFMMSPAHREIHIHCNAELAYMMSPVHNLT